MSLVLTIENVDRLADGGPLRVEADRRGLDIGRDTHLDWTLPDPSRTISGKHAEVRYQDGGYWLYDVSTNGTYVNESPHRMGGPHRLQHGDRLAIGHYIVAVSLEREDSDIGRGIAGGTGSGPNPWDAPEAAPPAARAEFQRQLDPGRAIQPDFLDWNVEIAPPAGGPATTTPPIPRPARPSAGGGGDILARIAAAAGIAPETLAARDPGEVADEIGAVLKVVAENLALMLYARSQTKGFIGSAERTTPQALENNPLKFGGPPGEALARMFGPPSQSYLGAVATVEKSFGDLKQHNIKVFHAMQVALAKLTGDLSPQAIETGTRRGRSWDEFVKRWNEKSKRADGRLDEAFMRLFAEAYDRR